MAETDEVGLEKLEIVQIPGITLKSTSLGCDQLCSLIEWLLKNEVIGKYLKVGTKNETIYT